MNKLKENPFRFGDPVSGKYYLKRENLSRNVAQFLENHIHVVLIGPRRFGKTSFVLDLLDYFEKQSYTCLFVDVFNITSHRDFLQQMLRALKTKKSWLDKIFDSIPKLRPKFTTEVNPTGEQSFGLSFEATSDKDIKNMIQDLLVSVQKLGKKVILAIDEFQKISEIDDKGWLEATLRTHMQQLKNTSFLFTGSRKGIIYDMLNNQSRPFYRSCQPIEFPSFGDEFTNWIVKRFTEVGIRCAPQAVSHLRKLVQDTPNYVQMVCFHLVAEGRTKITMDSVDQTVNKVVRQNAYAYHTLLNSLTLMQQRALRLAAIEGKEVYAKEFRSKYEISSAPALSSTFKSLKQKGLLDEEGVRKGVVVFDDPLFALWLKSSL